MAAEPADRGSQGMTMSIKVPGKSGYDGFARVCVIGSMQSYVKLNLDEGDADSLDSYLGRRLGILLSPGSILSYAFRTMLVSQNGDIYTYSFNPALTVPGYGMRLSDAVGLIEYGNMEVKGCGIVSGAFGYVRLHLCELLDSYIHGNGGTANGSVTVR